MTVLITGGAGFLGQRLAARLLAKGSVADAHGRARAIDRLVLLDTVAAPASPDPRVVPMTGDIADPAMLERVIDTSTTSIFHLAAVVSGQAESDFDLGMRVNLDATRRMLDICRMRGHQPRVLFTSSVAVYGGTLPDPVPDTTAVTPESSYGTEKAISELLINDYSRRGFIDGRALRLPTISVRPGRPNAALSSFASGIIREPLNGQVSACPVSPDTRLWLLSPATAIECLVLGHDLPARAFGSNRCLNVPGISISVGEMVAALERVAGPEAVAHIRWERDARVEQVAGTWPAALDASRARALGFPCDTSFDDMIRQYLAHDRRH